MNELKRAAAGLVIEVGVVLVQTCEKQGNKGAPASVISLALAASGVPEILSDRLLLALENTKILRKSRGFYFATPLGRRWANALDTPAS